MEVRPGYKQTDAGIIPNDWQTAKIGEISNVGRGRVISHREIAASSHHSHPVYSSQTTNNGVMGYIDTYDFDGEYITWTTDGVNAGTVFYRNGRFNCTNVCGTVKLNNQSALYLAKVLTTLTGPYVSRNLANPKLMNDVFKQIAVPLPPLPEQRAIAAALSDVDALLAAQDKLIAKKQGIKQATMQELLTGIRRLPGFAGAWTTCVLGDKGSFTKGKGIKKDEVVADGLPCVRYGEIYTRYSTYVDRFYSYITPKVAKESQQLSKGDLLFAGSGETAEEIGKCVAFLDDQTAFAGGDIVIFKPLKQNSLYLGYLMNHPSVVEQKARLGQGDAVVHISATNLGTLHLNLPPFKEQTAIATVLSDMDAEIAALTQQRDKTRLLKQGMMQELLTGKTRLVNPAPGAPTL